MQEQTVYKGYLIEVQDMNPGFRATIEDTIGEKIGDVTGTHRGNVLTKAKRQVDQSILREQKAHTYEEDTRQKVRVSRR